MTKKIILPIVALVIIVAAIVSLVQNNAKTNKIKIGVITALTGPAGVATYGVPLKGGSDLALKEIDPLATKYQLIYEDYQLDTKQALPAYAKLKGEGVKIFIIDGSPALTVLAPEIRKDGFMAFNTSSFIPSYKDSNPLTCRMALTSDNYGPAYAELLVNRLKINKVIALIPNFEAGLALLDSFKKSFGDLGGTVVSQELYAKDATDFRTNITKLKTYTDAQAIFVVNYFNSAEILFKQMKDLGLTIPIVTDDWTATLPKDKSLLNGGYFIGYSFSVTDPNTDTGRKFYDLYKVTYDTSPLINAVQSYDMMHIIDLAVKGSGSFEPVALTRYLTSDLGIYSGVGGSISFNSDCEAERDISVGQIQNGQAVLLNK